VNPSAVNRRNHPHSRLTLRGKRGNQREGGDVVLGKKRNGRSAARYESGQCTVRFAELQNITKFRLEVQRGGL
jgi:hypothetical protein